MKIKIQTLGRAADVALVAVAIGASVLMFRELLLFEYGRDQGIYAMVADVMLRGGAPYQDAWDFKPPGIFLVFAAVRVVLGTDMSAIRIFEVGAFGALVLAFAVLSRRYVGSAIAGIVGGALAVYSHVRLGFWSTGQPESFGAVAVAWALVCVSYEADAGKAGGRWKERAAWLAGGALYGLAALMKPPLGAGLLVSSIVLFYRRRGTGSKGLADTLLAPALAMGAGAGLVCLCVCGYFLAHGAWDDLYEALFVFAPEYTRISFRPEWFTSLFFRSLQELLFKFSWINLAGITLLVALRSPHPRAAEGVAHVGGILVFQLAGIAVQAKFFTYHFDAALTLVALLAGWGFWKLRLAGGETGLGVLAIGAIVFLLHDVSRPPKGKVFHAPAPMPKFAQRYNTPRRMVAQWLATNTPPESTVFVWGFEPVIYDLAQRRPASRYIYNVPQRSAWSEARSRAELLEDIRRSDPAAIVVDSEDVMPWVTGNSLSSAGSLAEFPELRDLLRDEYEHARTVGRFTIYAKKGRSSRSRRTP